MLFALDFVCVALWGFSGIVKAIAQEHTEAMYSFLLAGSWFLIALTHKNNS